VLLCGCSQVTLAHRLGVANVYDPVRPSMHYRLRMWRADEHQVRLTVGLQAHGDNVFTLRASTYRPVYPYKLFSVPLLGPGLTARVLCCVSLPTAAATLWWL